MSIHLIPSKSPDRTTPNVLMSYENGSVKLWTYERERNEGRRKSVEGIGWVCVWDVKVHVETSESHVYHLSFMIRTG
jgi:hypothetical protein